MNNITFSQHYCKYAKIIAKSVYLAILFSVSKKVGSLNEFVGKINNPIDFSQESFEKKLKQYLNNKPLHQILKKIKFLNIDLNIKKNILSPRDETEILVDESIKIIKDKFKKEKRLDIIDVCCGSGNIGLSIKKNINKANVMCVDINKACIKITKENAKLNKLDIKTSCADCCDIKLYQKKYDCLISNPPYVLREDLDITLLENEDINCFCDNKGDFFIYKFFIKNIPLIMKKKFVMIFEIGINSKKVLEDYIKSLLLPNIEYKFSTDLSNIDRMLIIQNKD
jgi:release factor glutamine methyltransferase